MSRVVLTSLTPTVVLSSLTGYQGFSVSSPSSVTFSVAGPKGDAGSGITWRGDYDPTVSYAVMDAVVYNGSSYICEVACSGITPVDGVNWSVMAAAGGELGDIDLGQFV